MVDGGGATAREARAALPCLNSHNSVQEEEDSGCPWEAQLSPRHRKMAFVLTFEIQDLAKKYGIETLGFLTLTFADQVFLMKEANRRFNNLNSNVIRHRYERGIVVWERQKSGRPHAHLLVVCGQDIRTGANFAAFERRDYRSANPVLRAEWAFWRRTAPAYRFGRTELLPVKSTVDGISKYVGKYVGKYVARREERDKGHRLARFLGYGPGDRKASCQFMWNSSGSRLWRYKLASFAASIGVKDMDDIAKVFGPRWAYHFRRAIDDVGPRWECIATERGVSGQHPPLQKCVLGHSSA